MAICKILVHYPNSENWQVGDVVDISAPEQLVKEGKVELYVPESEKKETVFVAEAKPAKKAVKKQKKETIKSFLRGFGKK